MMWRNEEGRKGRRGEFQKYGKKNESFFFISLVSLSLSLFLQLNTNSLSNSTPTLSLSIYLSPPSLTSQPQVVRHPVALQGLEPLEVQQALCEALARRVAVDDRLQVANESPEHGRVLGERVSDRRRQLRAQQGAGSELVGQQEGHRFRKRGMD